ncbi:hypothetical protein ACIA5C_31600 [Actinoplanes sp. NPDC051343]|jgi:hypothetical protein|uniref:hypothetical protein n=1 Tax=Actinoplanes sp. NPDC051343 TaxID=3363906 RepID=UPI0037B6675B
MTQVFGLLAVVAGLVVVLAPFVLLARRIRRSNAGARLMGPLDEIYNVGALKTRQEQQVMEYRAAPRPSADDGPRS